MIPESELVKFSRAQIQAGSKSFNFASFFFDEKQRHGAWLLYSWCRFCDDEIDGATDSTAAVIALEKIERETRRLLRLAETDLPATSTEDSFSSLGQAAFRGLFLVVKEFNIPAQYPLDLLRGFRMDVEGRQFKSLAELDEYCYCVAGVVGLMMCHITGVSSSKAFDHAVAMGSAMQLTNIARDVDQDWKMGRIYIPHEWLREFLIEPVEFGSAANRQKWPALAKRLLDQADLSYQIGDDGLKFLSFRSALAVTIASQVYREIGVKVRAHGAEAWNKRLYVSSLSKLAKVPSSLLKRIAAVRR